MHSKAAFKQHYEDNHAIVWRRMQTDVCNTNGTYSMHCALSMNYPVTMPQICTCTCSVTHKPKQTKLHDYQAAQTQNVQKCNINYVQAKHIHIGK